MNRKVFKATMLAAALCLGTIATPALAEFNLSIDIGIPPPPPRHEVYEPSRPGYVLVPGYWFWDGRQHQWTEHRWERNRPGQRFQAAHWDQRGGRHHFEPGRWEPEHRFDRNDRGNNGNHGDKGNKRNKGNRGNGNSHGGRGNS